MSKSKVLYGLFFLIPFLIGFNTTAKSQSSDSLITDNDFVSLHKRISIAAIAGKRTDDLSINLGIQFLTYINWKKIDVGLGVNYENEDYFNLIPAYVHFAYSFDQKRNPTKLFLNSGLAFNIPQSSNYDYGKPGILIGSGIEQHFKLFKIIPAAFQMLYRFQQTTTVKEWTANQQNTNSKVIKHNMNRLILVFGVNF